MLADVVYVPVDFGIGDKMNGMTTAMWLAKRLRRPLKVCFPFLPLLRLETLPENDCTNLAQGVKDKGERFWAAKTNTHYVGCKHCRGFSYVSRGLWRVYWRNETFLHTLNSSARVVVSINRNVASVDGIEASRRLLREAFPMQKPRYDVCIHHRSFRSKLTVDALLRCFRTDPVVVFTDYASRHLHVKDRKQTTLPSKFSNDTNSFLELCRCREYRLPASSFSIAAALASNASLDKIIMYSAENCSKQMLLKNAVTMFNPHM